MATGGDAVQPGDAASKVNLGVGNSDYMDTNTKQVTHIRCRPIWTITPSWRISLTRVL
ncbi:hypothetical protein LINPERPRIM_LOCUS30845 [Linum perenne]